MSETVTRGREAGPQAEAGKARRPRRPGGWVALGLVMAVLAVGVVSAWRAGVFSPAGPSGSGPQASPGACDAGGSPGGPVGDDTGERDAGICRVVPGDRAGRRDTDLAAAGRAGDPPGACAVQDRQRLARGAAVRQRAGLAQPGRGLGERRFSPASTTTWWTSATQGRAETVALGWDYFSWETAYGVRKLEEHPWGLFPRRGRSCWGRWCSSGGDPGVPGDGEPGRPGGRPGAGRDLRPPPGVPMPVGCLRAVGRVRAGDTVR